MNPRKVIFQIGVSLDGFIQGPNGDLEWMFINLRFKNQLQQSQRLLQLILESKIDKSTGQHFFYQVMYVTLSLKG